MDGLLNEEGCPEKDRMTRNERARWEEMRRAIDESKLDETQARSFLERLRQSLVEPEPRVTKKDVELARAKIKKMITEHQGHKPRLREWWTERTTKKKPPGSGHVM